jgi:hypothetical protein
MVANAAAVTWSAGKERGEGWGVGMCCSLPLLCFVPIEKQEINKIMVEMGKREDQFKYSTSP